MHTIHKDDNSSASDIEEFENCRMEKENSHPQFQFWSQVLTIEMLVLEFIRSIRETILSCIGSLCQNLPLISLH